MKLFVWTEFSPDYSNGLAFAISEDVIEAQKMIETEMGYTPLDWGNLQIVELDTPFARCVSGGM